MEKIYLKIESRTLYNLFINCRLGELAKIDYMSRVFDMFIVWASCQPPPPTPAAAAVAAPPPAAAAINSILINLCIFGGT